MEPLIVIAMVIVSGAVIVGILASPIFGFESDIDRDCARGKSIVLRDWMSRVAFRPICYGLLVFGFIMVTDSCNCMSHRSGGFVRDVHYSSRRIDFENGRNWQLVPKNVLKRATPGCQLVRTTTPFGYQVADKSVNGLVGVLGEATFGFTVFAAVGMVIGLVSPWIKPKSKRSAEEAVE